MPFAQKIFGQFFIWFFHVSWNSGQFLENQFSGFLKKFFFIFLKDGYRWGKQPLERAKFDILAHLASRGDRPAQIMVRAMPYLYPALSFPMVEKFKMDVFSARYPFISGMLGGD